MAAATLLKPPLVIGLTGGIGCGKSTAARYFRELGATTLDADDLSRAVSAPGGAAYQEIIRVMGERIVRPDGSLDRATMRALVFADPELRRALEAVTHPCIAAAARREIAGWQTPYGLWIAPLLLEANSLTDLIQRVLVIDCSEEQQIARVSQTRGLSGSTVRDIMRAQLPRAERLLRADDVLDNSGSEEQLAKSIRELDRFYRKLAATAPNA